MVPANRTGYLHGFSAFQLKIIQEVVTLVVFSFFAVLVLKEPFHVKYLISFLFLFGAVYFMFKKWKNLLIDTANMRLWKSWGYF